MMDSRKTEQMIHAPKYNEWVRDSWHPFWVMNMCRTYHTIERIFQSRNADISQLPRKDGEPVLILGSGPSLDDMRPYIKDWKGDIICSTSQLQWLSSLKRNPTYIFLIDSDPTMNYLISGYEPEPDQPCPKFITHPCIQREAIEAWNRLDDIYFFRMLDPGDELFTKFLPMAYQTIPMPPKEDSRGVRTYIMNSGNVMNTMMVFSGDRGYSPVFLCGYDLGYPAGKDGVPQYRFTDYEKKDGEWVAKPSPPVPQNRQFRPSHNGVLTDELCLFYKYSTMILYGMASPGVLSCSRGIVDEIPYVSPEAVVRQQGKGFVVRKPEEAYKVAQEYLRHRKIYILKTGFSVSVQNTTGMKLVTKLKHLAYWHRWKDRLDWEEQAKKYAKKAAKKNKKAAKIAERKKKKEPYDVTPTHLLPTTTQPFHEAK